MADEEQTRDEIEEIANDDEPVQEAVIETITEEEIKPPVKAKAKSKAKAKIKITKQPIEPIKEEECSGVSRDPLDGRDKVPSSPIKEEDEPVVEEPPEKIDKNKQTVQCPDCHLSMTQHTLKYTHKKRGYCKGAFQESKTETTAEVKTVKDTPGLTKQKPTKTITNITDEIANTYIRENPETVTNYLRNERVMKTQRKQMHARSLLNNAF